MADIINYKCFTNSKYQVLSKTGFQDFKGILIGDNPNKIKLTFENTEIICTPKHKFVDRCGFKYAKDFTVGDAIQGHEILNIQIIENDDKLYDFLEVSGNHSYLTTNGIEHKNCLIVDECAFIAPHIMDEFWNSVVPIISSSSKSKLFLLSCVTDSTYVYTSNGIQQVKDFINYDKILGYEVPRYSILGKDKLRTGNLMYNSGESATKKIVTSFSELECSPNHKLWACVGGNFGWHKSEDLKVGDYVAVQYGMDVWGNDDDISTFNCKATNNRCKCGRIPKTMTEELAYFIGLYIAEGYARSNHNQGGQVCITCGDNVSTALEALGYGVSYSRDGIHYTVSSLELVEFLKYLGFDISKKAKEKIIPPRVLRMSKNVISHMLRGMFDGDGTTHGQRGVVAYTSTSEELINQLRVILNNFGILSCKYYYRTGKTKLVNVESDRWVLEISGNYSKVFYETIGFNFGRKQMRRELLSEVSAKNTLDVVPISQSALRHIIRNNKIKNKTLIKHGLNLTGPMYSKNKPSSISRTKLLVLKNSGLVTDERDKNLLDVICNDSIRWDRIKSIDASKNHVYDFSLPDNSDDEFSHSVIYNGIIGHQTPNGTSNKFYEIYSKAERGESEWHAERMDWWEIPGRGKKWQQDMIDSLGSKEAFDQEFGNMFVETGESAISGTILDRWRSNRKVPILTLESGHYQIWEAPNEKRIYSIGVDVSEGVGEAASVVQVLDITDLSDIRQVACYHDALIDPHFFAEIIYKIANQWGRPYLAIERNNAGGQVLDVLQYTHGYNKFLNIYSSDNANSRLGIYSSTKTKYRGVSNMRYWTNTLDVVGVNDLGLIQELETFIRRPNSVWKKKDGSGIRDDRVDAFFWALMILETEYCEQYFEVLAHDDRGKPKKIKQLFIESPEFYKLDKMYQSNPNSPFPVLFGFAPDDPNNPSPDELRTQGWNFLI